MSNLFARGNDFRTRTLAVAAGITSLVITPIDALGTITVTNAVAGRTEVDVTSPGQAGSRREINEREYLIPVASLVRSSATVLPASGDRYAETINGVPYVFQVLQVPGKPAWDWCDHERTQVRVRTKRVP